MKQNLHVFCWLTIVYMLLFANGLMAQQASQPVVERYAIVGIGSLSSKTLPHIRETIAKMQGFELADHCYEHKIILLKVANTADLRTFFSQRFGPEMDQVVHKEGTEIDFKQMCAQSRR